MGTVARSRINAAFVLTSLLAFGCSEKEPGHDTITPVLPKTVKVMKLTSSGFEDGARLDAKYTVEGQDLSPPLAWSDVPAGTKSFALVCDDPDAPSPRRPAADPWVHWVLFNLASDVTQLPPGIPRTPEPSELPGAKQGRNSWPSDNVGYRGPAPPPGSGPHRYFFKLYALDAVLDLDAGATKGQLLDAMSGHVLAQGQLIGVYER